MPTRPYFDARSLAFSTPTVLLSEAKNLSETQDRAPSLTLRVTGWGDRHSDTPFLSF